MTTRSEDEIRRRDLIATVAKKLWLDKVPVKKIEEATGATYQLFRSCIMEKDPNFFENHERKRGRRYKYRNSLTPEELASAARAYLLKELSFAKICSMFNIAPYLLRKLLKEAGVWRTQGNPNTGRSYIMSSGGNPYSHNNKSDESRYFVSDGSDAPPNKTEEG